MDIFGGSECYEANEEETEHDDFSYFWDQDSYDPVTNEAMFYIHKGIYSLDLRGFRDCLIIEYPVHVVM